jgi:hypothetical protein
MLSSIRLMKPGKKRRTMRRSNLSERAARNAEGVTNTSRYLELNAEGKTVAQIAEATGTSYQAVYSTLKAKGATINKATPDGEKSKSSAIMELWNEDIPVNEIPKKLKELYGWDVKYQMVYNTLKRKGVFDKVASESKE